MNDAEQRNRNDIELQAWNCWHDRCAIGRVGHFDREHPEWELHPEWESALRSVIGSTVSRQMGKYGIRAAEFDDLVQRFDTAVIAYDEKHTESKCYKDFVWDKVANSPDPPLKVIRGKLTGLGGFVTRVVVEDIFREMGARKTTDKETGKDVWLFNNELKEDIRLGYDSDDFDAPLMAMGEALKDSIGLEKTNEQELARENREPNSSPEGEDADSLTSQDDPFPRGEEDADSVDEDMGEGGEDGFDENHPLLDPTSRIEDSVDIFLYPFDELPPDLAKVAESINYRTSALLFATMTSLSLDDPQLCSFCGIKKSAAYNLWKKFSNTIQAQSLRGHSNQKLLQAAQDAILSHPGGEQLWQRFRARIEEYEQKTVDAEAKKRGY